MKAFWGIGTPRSLHSTRNSYAIHVPTLCATRIHGMVGSTRQGDKTGKRAAAISLADVIFVSFSLIALPGYCGARHSTLFSLHQSNRGLDTFRTPVPSLVYMSSAFPAFGKHTMRAFGAPDGTFVPLLPSPGNQRSKTSCGTAVLLLRALSKYRRMSSSDHVDADGGGGGTSMPSASQSSCRIYSKTKIVRILWSSHDAQVQCFNCQRTSIRLTALISASLSVILPVSLI